MKKSKIEESINALRKAILALRTFDDWSEIEHWEWWTKERVRQVKSLDATIRDAIRLLSKVEGSESIEMLDEDLQLIEMMLDTLKQVHEGNKRYRAIVKEWPVTPKDLTDRLKRIRSILQSLLEHPNGIEANLGRRALLSLGVTAVGAAGVLGPASLLKEWQEGDRQETAIEKSVEEAARSLKSEERRRERPRIGFAPGYYIQVAARDRLEEAEERARGNNLLAIHETPSGENRFKILRRRRHADLATAQRTLSGLLERGLNKDAGVVLVKPDGSTEWQPKAFEKEVKERMKNQKRKRALPNHYRKIVEEAVKNYPYYGDVRRDTALIEAMMDVESRYGRFNLSVKGARGPMQVMSATFRLYHDQLYPSKKYLHERGHPVRHDCDIDDPGQNIDAGVHVLSKLKQLYPRMKLADHLKMYNGGNAAYLSGKLRRNDENRKYPGKVVDQMRLRLISNQS